MSVVEHVVQSGILPGMNKEASPEKKQESVERIQHYAGLPVTGKMNEATQQEIDTILAKSGYNNIGGNDPVYAASLIREDGKITALPVTIVSSDETEITPPSVSSQLPQPSVEKTL